MFKLLKRLIKWALIVAAVAGTIRWLKNKRQADEAEQDQGSIEPWPPLDDTDSSGGAAEPVGA